MKKLHVVDLPLKGKRALVRVDFNVPLNQEGKITDDTRIRAALPTLRYIVKQGGIPIVMSHLGRPKGERKPQYSLHLTADRLASLLGCRVTVAPDCVGNEVEQLVDKAQPGEVVLLENLRFHPGEEHPEKEPTFAQQLARLGDVYIDDAFGAAHRAHASIVEVPHLFPNQSAAGYLLEKEIKYLGDTLLCPKRPFVAIIGGAKVSTKIGVLSALVKKVDALFIGGGMAFTFLKAKGIPIGKSLLDSEHLITTQQIIAECQNRGVELWLPEDIRVAPEFAGDAPSRLIDASEGIPENEIGLDVGPKTIAAWQPTIERAATILWNGPLGAFELPVFAEGTVAMAHILASCKGTTIVGGGDSVAAIKAASLSDCIDHVSTGGGASLEYIQFGSLPGVEALSDTP